MTKFTPLREIPAPSRFKKGDLMVVFGELFARGYANGIVDEAQKAGLKIIYSTMGRRDDNDQLRPLTAEELAEKSQPCINVPLEAGFDLEPSNQGVRPVDQLKDYGLTGWENAKLNWQMIEESRNKGVARFRTAVTQYLTELKKHITPGQNVIFVHTMAGGFPRAKVVMPIANRVFKGSGARFQSSEVFWKSEIGRLCEMSFNEVTAETFRHLIELSAELRNEITKAGGNVSYVAYGYHGNEALIDGQYQWYSYSPYLQGWAKIALENIAAQARESGVQAAVFNVPEILTNSSSIFLGLEISLYSLISAIQKENGDLPAAKDLVQKCEALLKPGFTYADVERAAQNYLTDPDVKNWPDFETWPQHNGPVQMEKMRNTSSAILEMHADQKRLLTAELSEIVFRACGKVMFSEGFTPRSHALWIGHDLVAKCFSTL